MDDDNKGLDKSKSSSNSSHTCNGFVNKPEWLDVKVEQPEVERPKTRRHGFIVYETDEDKFRCSPREVVVNGSDYDLLKSKLNTISETTESDSSKASVPLEKTKSNKGNFIILTPSVQFTKLLLQKSLK